MWTDLTTQHEVLRSQRKSRHHRLDSAKPAEGPGKDEQEFRAQDLEAACFEEPPRLRRSQGHGVAVERAPAHHETSGGIPGIVLPEGEQSSRMKLAVDIVDGGRSFGR